MGGAGDDERPGPADRPALWIEPYLLLGAQQAVQDAARQAALLQARQAAGQGPGPGPDGDVDLESVGRLLEDEDDDQDAGYGQIMVSMTRPSRRERPRPPG